VSFTAKVFIHCRRSPGRFGEKFGFVFKRRSRAGKGKHIHPPETATSQAKRLRSPSRHKALWRDKQATAGSDFTSKASLGCCEDVPASLHYAVARKKSLRLLSEELLRLPRRGKLQKREVKPCGFVFLPAGQKEWRRELLSNPLCLKPGFNLEKLRIFV